MSTSMGEQDINFVQIPEHLQRLLGEPDEGTRMFRRYGTQAEFREWWDAVCEVCDGEGAVSPGGVAMYARVSRAGVHKRMKEGRITAFLFHVVKGTTWFTKRELLANAGMPYIYIPGIECKAWAELLTKKASRDEVKLEVYGDGDFEGVFLRARGRKNKKG